MFIKSVSIPAADQERALKFYTNKLGFIDSPNKQNQSPTLTKNL